MSKLLSTLSAFKGQQCHLYAAMSSQLTAICKETQKDEKQNKCKLIRQQHTLEKEKRVLTDICEHLRKRTWGIVCACFFLTRI